MKTINTKTIAVAFASLFLFACDRNEEQEVVAPLQASNQSDLVGYDPTTCNMVQTFGQGALPRHASLIEEDGAIMIVKAQRRGQNGKYLEETDGILLDPRDPATDLVNMFDAQMLGMSGGLLTVADESGLKANRKGGRVILNFSPVGSVTMKTMLFTDIAEEDRGSMVALYSRSGQLLEQKEIPVAGKNASVFVSFNNVPGVAKAIVTFGAERQSKGSGAIARLQLCVDGKGRYDDARYKDVHTMWLEYTGSQPANVDITAQNGSASKVLLSAKGMKPGTIFKLSTAQGGSLGKTLEINTSRREKHSIAINEDRSNSLKKQYGNFRVIEARCTEYPLRLE